MSEIAKFPRAVLKHHYPETPLHGDFTTIEAGQYDPIDLLVGGTPCQSFSIAGLRGGLDDDRGNLALEYLRLAQRLRPRWLVWENVPGVLSSNGGRDFGAILGGLVELGYGFAYRVLDAQYAGVPQRRRRVFVVGYLGDWRRAAAVLFERHSLSGHPAPRREAGARVAGSLEVSTHDWSRADIDAGRFVTNGLDEGEISRSLTASHTATNRLDPFGETYVASAFRVTGNAGAYETKGFAAALTGNKSTHDTAIAFAMRGRAGGAMPEVHDDASALRSASGGSTRDFVAFNITPSNSNTDYCAREASHAQALAAGSGRPSARGGDFIAFDTTQVTSRQNGSNPQPGDPSHPLSSTAHAPALAHASGVRRLTVTECERLQGFPDGFTRIPWNGWRPMHDSETPEICRENGMEVRQTKTGRWRVNDVDGPRYHALGNSMATPVVRWIGERIAMVDAL